MPRTDVRKFFESKYLGAWDIPEGKEAILVIARVEAGEVIGEGGRKDRAPLLYFRNVSNPKKPMVLNKTNTKALVRLYGPYIEEWPGKPLYLYASKTTVGGEERDCLRIRPLAPPPKEASSAGTLDDAQTREAGEEG